VAVEAFNRLRLPLVVAGDGPDRRRLRQLAGPTIRFAGRVSDEQVAWLLSSCRALVVTAGEEFGIAAVEAQAAGRPVIARAAGGLLENVVDGVTGCWWDGGADELAAAVASFDTASVDPAHCVANARRFDSSVFREVFPREVDAALRAGPAARVETWPRIPRRLPQARRPGWAPRRFSV
jgi:glycosyltransferase involved in cell wall biosynthesis